MAAYRELDFQKTPYGELILRRRSSPSIADEVIYEVKLNDEFLMSSLVHRSEKVLAERGLEGLTGELDVVVGGLGLGCTARAALDVSAVRSLLVVELFDPVIDWHRRGLVPEGEGLCADVRCRFVQGDFFAMAAGDGFDPDQPGRCFDAVLLDIDHSPRSLLHAGHASFYEQDGLRRMANHLVPGGAFALWSADAVDEPFLGALREVFDTVVAHEVPFHNPSVDEDELNTVYVARAGSVIGLDSDMRSQQRLTLTLALTLSWPLPSLATQDPVAPVKAETHPATVRLLSEHPFFVPGRKFTVGLHLRMEKGWHVYWKNPGDSGAPPTLTWTLPDGWTAGPLRFPAPHRYTEGDLVTFGYEMEVLLLTDLVPPKEWKPETVALKASATWLVCKDQCLDGKADLSLTLANGPADAERDRDLEGLFYRTRLALPRDDGVRWDSAIVVDASAMKQGGPPRAVTMLFAVGKALPEDAEFTFFPETESAGEVLAKDTGRVVNVDGSKSAKGTDRMWAATLNLEPGLHRVAAIPLKVSSSRDVPAGILVVKTEKERLAFRYAGPEKESAGSGSKGK